MDEEDCYPSKRCRLTATAENLQNVDAILSQYRNENASVASTIISLSNNKPQEDIASIKASNIFLKVENERKDALIDDLLRKLNQSIEVIQQQAQRIKEFQRASGALPEITKTPPPQPKEVSPQTPPKMVTPIAPSLPLTSSIKLIVRKQPPSQAIYQRILRPFPIVEVVGADVSAIGKYFVEVSLLKKDCTQTTRTDEYQPVSWFKNSGSPLEGDREKNIVGGLATFRKLKILTTSSQQGAFFVLKFTLKRFADMVEVVPEVQPVISTPIEVFSHTLYLKSKTGAASGSLTKSTDSLTQNGTSDEDLSPQERPSESNQVDTLVIPKKLEQPRDVTVHS